MYKRQVFIDEVQDTNELQDAILSLIARPKTSFRVGDVKQSIYHFRHTDPSLFLARYHQYSPEDDAEQVRIDLKENYRSCANVLHGVNWVMQRCMQPPVCLLYTSQDRRNPQYHHQAHAYRLSDHHGLSGTYHGHFQLSGCAPSA